MKFINVLREIGLRSRIFIMYSGYWRVLRDAEMVIRVHISNLA